MREATTLSWILFCVPLTIASCGFPRPPDIAGDAGTGVSDGGGWDSQSPHEDPTTIIVVSTLAGASGSSGSIDGIGDAARFNRPTGAAVDRDHNIYIADRFNHIIRKISAAGEVSTFAGAAGIEGSVDGTGASARFRNPAALAVGHDGNVYVADQSNHTIRKITSAGVVTTLAGTAGQPGSTDGERTSARFNNPLGVALDSSGNVYVSDYSNSNIRKISTSGMVFTIAGLAGESGSIDGTGAAARFFHPVGIATDLTGIIYISDTGNHIIRKISLDGIVTTIAGGSGTTGSTDGTGTTARFANPWGIACDSAGSIYIADQANHTIRMIVPSNEVTTIAGNSGSPDDTNGVGVLARFSSPSGLAVDGDGAIYVADQFNNSVRKIAANRQ